MKSPLENLAESIQITIAMAADEQQLGVDRDGDKFNRWTDRLHQAVDDGLEDAGQRCGIFDWPIGE